MQRALRRALLGRLLASTVRLGDRPARHPHLDFEHLLVVRAHLARQPVLRQHQVAGLRPLLQRGLVVGTEVGQAARPHFLDEITELFVDKRLGRLDATVEIDRGDDCLVGICDYRRLPATTGLFLAPPEEQMIPERQLLAQARQ